MRVEKCSDNRIEIHLSREEIHSIFGGYEYIDYNEIGCREKIHRIVTENISGAYFPLDCDKLLIEVRPARYGCNITLTKLYESKSNNISVAMIFNNSDDLISAVPLMRKTDTKTSALYTYNGKFAIICALPRFCRHELNYMSEYAKITLRATDAAKIEEYWQPVCEDGAIEKLSMYF